MKILKKKNYQAWLVNESDFPKGGSFRDKMIFILNYAVLAPSAHNTQPWLFKVEDNSLSVFINKKRMLGESDPLMRQTYESIGACIVNIEIASNHFGFLPQTNYFFNENVEDDQKIIVAKINFAQTNQPNKTNYLFKQIINRHSGKLAYSADSVNKEVIEIINSLEKPPNLNINFFFKPEEIKIAADAVSIGTAEAFKDKVFCKELSEWLRPNNTKDFDGMPGFTVGIPTVMSWIVPKIIANLNVEKMQVEMMTDIALKTPCVGVVSGTNTIPSWVEAGRIFQKIALMAQNLNLSTAIMGAPVEVKSAAMFLKEKLNLPGDPVLFFRIGKKLGKTLYAPRHLAGSCIL